MFFETKGQTLKSHSKSASFTREGVDEQAEDHGHHGDEDPMGELLVLHAAVDGYARLVTLEQRQSPSQNRRKRIMVHQQ